MDTVQLEKLLLVLSPVVFGFFPALLDVISLKRKPPNMLIALLVAISSLWHGRRGVSTFWSSYLGL
ncbi:MAG: hypothetical protein EON54_28700 [Alcaligenaceae bacterium]|nr:MAG: hypothetical protein EON54_28700 [Alcaligenaceae bacterium]